VRSNLELFVLALVQNGHSTPYELKTKVGLSLGSTVPVLARLEKDVLVKASEPGLRRSRRYSITAKGAKVLAQGWAEQLATRPNDIDSILRVAYLAWLNGDNEACMKFLERSSESLRGWSSSLGAEANRLAVTITEKPDGDTFMWLRTYCEAARAEAEAAALVELSRRINKNKETEKKNKPTITRRKPRP
jgi:DNA-binding PadR family transcriptional regulator